MQNGCFWCMFPSFFAYLRCNCTREQIIFNKDKFFGTKFSWQHRTNFHTDELSNTHEEFFKTTNFTGQIFRDDFFTNFTGRTFQVEVSIQDCRINYLMTKMAKNWFLENSKRKSPNEKLQTESDKLQTKEILFFKKSIKKVRPSKKYVKIFSKNLSCEICHRKTVL